MDNFDIRLSNRILSRFAFASATCVPQNTGVKCPIYGVYQAKRGKKYITSFMPIFASHHWHEGCNVVLTFVINCSSFCMLKAIGRTFKKRVFICFVFIAIIQQSNDQVQLKLCLTFLIVFNRNELNLNSYVTDYRISIDSGRKEISDPFR